MFKAIVKRVAIVAALVLVFVVFGYGMVCMLMLLIEILRA
jgi:hypothetical protein